MVNDTHTRRRSVPEVALSRLCGEIIVSVRSDIPLPLHMHAAMFVTSFIDDVLRNTVPSVNEPLLQLVNAVFRFCVISGSVET